MEPELKTGLSVVTLLKMHYQSMHKSERQVADFLLNNPCDNVLNSSIVELAARINVSEATVIRVCKRIGFSGYTEFKLRLAEEKGQSASYAQNEMSIPISKEDKLEDLPRQIIVNSINGLRDTLTVLDPVMLERAISAVMGARQVVLFGVANSAIVCEDLNCKLMRIGILCRTYADAHMQVIAAHNLTAEDVVIAVSHSGRTVETVDAARCAREKGATVICISNYLTSPLVDTSDIQLLTGGHETSFNSETMVSRLSQLAIVDMLYVGLILQDYDKHCGHLTEMNNAMEKMAYS